jgi:hypothetical protein
MMCLSAALAFTLLAAAGTPRPCAPAHANTRVRVSLLADTDLAALAKWAHESTCVDYGFDPALGSRRLAQAVILTVAGRDVGPTFEILLHSMNLRSYARGNKRWIVPDGPETADSREANERARADNERAETLAHLDAEIRRKDDAHYTISRKGADAVMTSLTSLARGVRVSPETRAGKPVGFRLAAIRAGGLLTRVGLQSGDVVTSLNGAPLTSPDKAMEAYAKFRTTGVVRADCLRDGKAFSVELKVE